MATTTQVISYRSAGQPDDSVGSVGDICWDTTNRITWVKQSGNTWVGGSYSNIGPTGPACLTSTGAPASGYGQQGNGYIDLAAGNTYLKSSSGWSQTGSIIGPQGTAGVLTLGSMATQLGGQFYFNGTLSSTAQAMTVPGTTQTAVFIPTQSSALTALVAVNNTSNVAATLTLYDQTASSTVGTFTLAAGGNIYTTYGLTTYPLTAGHQYIWQATGSGAGIFQMEPFYLSPASAAANTVQTLSGFTSATSTTFSSTATYIGPFGKNNTSGLCRSCVLPKAGGLYAISGTYWPSTTGAATATVSAALYGYSLSANSTSTYATASFTNTGVQQMAVGPLSSPTSLPSGVAYYFAVTGSGTGQLDVNLQVIL